ncbi:hypothetical protein [Carboxylicivirga sp. N1Y90]|uniref:hypothetical protein n=1 Tax=Carboxylicivirga fragile TaxID=3417571 RepID=UPI003D329F00|nr:hypothetical protein [Marinilabiliaceae bacterium N1Y90]
MRIIEKFEVIKRASALIDKETTGPAEQFAKRIGTSRTCIFQLLEEIKELGVPITYDHRKKSYCYSSDKKLVVNNPIEVVNDI